MRIMLDTNVLISAIIFKSKMMHDLIATILSEHKLVLSSYVVNELKEVVARKFCGKTTSLDEFLTALPYEFVYTPDMMNRNLFQIRDEMDYPVLYTAIIEDVDVLLTGDKDFREVEVEKPEILTPSEFLAKYMQRHFVYAEYTSETIERKDKPLFNIRDNYRKYLLSLDKIQADNYEGVKWINVIEFLILDICQNQQISQLRQYKSD